ncbi:hypothetical protein ADK64_10375 [Streptomyces sp. MMG1121]|nr:hypothetical protein ADK64_10375 [Streptomyces sp. MMG1121]
MAESSLFQARFGAALRADGVEAEGERRAVAAFRAAREAGVRRLRTRRRDDWRTGVPRGQGENGDKADKGNEGEA